jgi:hypothetical protein
MLKRTGLAALSAIAFLTPGFATADAVHEPVHGSAAVTMVQGSPSAVTPSSIAPVQVATEAAAQPHKHGAEPSPAPGQAFADYQAWLARSPQHREEVRQFRSYLAAQGLAEVIPVWQLIRTSSSWRQCAADRFEVAPRDKWDNIVTTLKFVRDQVEPALGKVEALSVYRNESLNRCSNGAPASAHRMFFALDLKPVSDDVSRAGMIGRVCAAHARTGRTYNAGLGFYSGMRFHVDSHGFRKWGADGRGATSPCATGRYA